MAYNKNRRVFRSSRALERQKQIESNERSFRRVELDGLADKDMEEFIYQQSQKTNLPYINEIAKYIEDNKIKYEDLETIKLNANNTLGVSYTKWKQYYKPTRKKI